MSEIIKPRCNLCNGTKCLTQKGILRVYLLPAKFAVLLMIVGIVGGLFFSKYMFILSIAGLLYPLVNADFRFYLYPVTSLAHIMGKKLNCPKCEPHCSVFRKS